MMHKQHHWQRAIIHVDMNAFFAQIEQFDFPDLRGLPVVVTNGLTGTGIITSSYEARAYGIKTCMRIKDAKKLCPHLVQRSARPQRYSEISKNIMGILENITPDIEIFSVDEAFLDISRCQKLLGNPEFIALMVKQKVFEASGLLCSIGLSSDKTTAKCAAKMQKPNGLTVVPPWEAESFLSTKPVTDLCGISTGIGDFLAAFGVYKCGDITKIPISVLSKRFGNPGRRIWYMCQGRDPDPIQTSVAAAKSMGHSKVMPPKTIDKNLILVYLTHMCEKLATRLRRHNLYAQVFLFRLKSHDSTGIKNQFKTDIPTHDGAVLYKICLDIFEAHHQKNYSYYQICICALDPKQNFQRDLFTSEDKQRNKLHQVIDKINLRFNEFTIGPSRLLKRSSIPNVISPAWKPFGHRQTIPNK